MKIQLIPSCILALVITAGSASYADEIYKWTDEDGNVHYEDRPSEVYAGERLQMSYNRTDSANVQQRVQAMQDSVTARNEARAERETAKTTAAESRAAAEEKAARCEKYREQLRIMLETPRVYRQDANGERSYLDDVQKEEARSQAEALIKETCDS